jgi:hypothetical protein
VRYTLRQFRQEKLRQQILRYVYIIDSSKNQVFYKNLQIEFVTILEIYNDEQSVAFGEPTLNLPGGVAAPNEAHE